jgi:hypothetical protein
MLRNLLTNVILWIHGTVKSIVSVPDYKIIDTSMEYFLDTTKTPKELDEFWGEESEEWDEETETFFKTLNFTDYKNTKIPGKRYENIGSC